MKALTNVTELQRKSKNGKSETEQFPETDQAEGLREFEQLASDFRSIAALMDSACEGGNMAVNGFSVYGFSLLIEQLANRLDRRKKWSAKNLKSTCA